MIFRSLSLYLTILFLTFIAISWTQTKPNIDKCDDAVVVIQLFDFQGNQIGHGSGFIIDSKGTVVTNYHVINDVFSMKVITDIDNKRETHEVERIISGDSIKDLAKISVKNKTNRIFPFLKLSEKRPSKGENVWAIGTPADEVYMNTLSEGIVSNLYFTDSIKIIQTTAEIAHGSSGGVLLNSVGEAIGVTSSGDGTSDGQRANINFAISVLETKNLPIIDKKSLVDPSKVPCQLSFYTNDPYIGSVYLYVDKIYIGKFQKYFKDNFKPNCGDTGTITRNLYSGTHIYTVYFQESKKYLSYSINLVPGECIVINILKPHVEKNEIKNKSSENKQTTKTPVKRKTDFSEFKFNELKFDNIISLSLTSNSFTSNFGEKRIIPFSLFYEARFKGDRNSLRFNYLFFKNKLNSTDYNISNSFNSFILDYKFIFPLKKNANYYISPCLGILDIVRYYYYPNYSYRRSENSFLIGPRLGIDYTTKNNLFFSLDCGVSVLTRSSYYNFVSEINMSIGYRFRKN
jgi:hypothetical protein